MSRGRRRLLEVALITLLIACVPVAKEVHDQLRGPAQQAQNTDDYPYGRKRKLLKQHCNWQAFEYLKPKLRQFYDEGSDGRRWAPERIASDFNYDFFYDFENDEIFCSRRKTPGGPEVFGQEQRQSWDFRAAGIKLCLWVLAICLPLYVLMLLFR